MIVAGLGCRRGCTAADLVAAVRLAETKAGLRAGALAAPCFKAHEAGLHAAAAALGLPLLLVGDAAMQAVQPRCPTRSATALGATGLASVAEAAALAASNGPLLLPRVAAGGATCALAGDGGAACWPSPHTAAEAAQAANGGPLPQTKLHPTRGAS